MRTGKLFDAVSDNGEYWFTLDEMTTVVGHKWEYGETDDSKGS